MAAPKGAQVTRPLGKLGAVHAIVATITKGKRAQSLAPSHGGSRLAARTEEVCERGGCEGWSHGRPGVQCQPW